MRRLVGEVYLFLRWLILKRGRCLLTGHSYAEEVGVGALVGMNRQHRRKIKRGKNAAVQHTHKKRRCSRCKKTFGKRELAL